MGDAREICGMKCENKIEGMRLKKRFESENEKESYHKIISK